MGFTNQSFPAGSHICLLYKDEAERKSIIGKFIKSGLRSGELVDYSTDSMSPDDVLHWLRNAGGYIPDGVISDQLSIRDAIKVLCPTGNFVPEILYNQIRDTYEHAVKCNYPGLRVTEEMSWALRDIPGSYRLMEYEANLNTLLPLYPITRICQYNENLFNKSTILNILKNHPLMIIGGQVIKNPYYLNPEEFMAEWEPKIRLSRSNL